MWGLQPYMRVYGVPSSAALWGLSGVVWGIWGLQPYMRVYGVPSSAALWGLSGVVLGNSLLPHIGVHCGTSLGWFGGLRAAPSPCPTRPHQLAPLIPLSASICPYRLGLTPCCSPTPHTQGSRWPPAPFPSNAWGPCGGFKVGGSGRPVHSPIIQILNAKEPRGDQRDFPNLSAPGGSFCLSHPLINTTNGFWG